MSDLQSRALTASTVVAIYFAELRKVFPTCTDDALLAAAIQLYAHDFRSASNN